MKFTAAGDAIIQRRIQDEFPGFDELTPFIEQGDARFFNLETTLNKEGECHGSQFSGGTYIRTTPRVLWDLQKFGFNMTSFNNNHALDFSYEGLYATLEALEETDLVHAGVGYNLAEAAAPRYLETPNGRVALIAVNTTFDAPMMAGTQNERVPGRAGINGLRKKAHLQVTKDELAAIRAIADRSNINASKDIIRREGYLPPLADGEAILGDLSFKEGPTTEYIVTIDPRDIERVKKAIFEAKLQADYIMISVHSHEISGTAKECPSKFLIDFAHTCIDEGAHAVIGHGPHLLRPIEVYKNCPIFYSLGDFILQLYNVEFGPADFFEKHGVDPNATMHELLATRSANFTRGLMTDWRMFLSVIPIWETNADNTLKSLRLVPIMGAMEGNKSEIGLPRLIDPAKVVEYLGEMSKPYGVTLTAAEDGLIDCKW